MNLLLIILLFSTACIYVGLAIAALLKKPGTPAARYFAAMVLLASVWATTCAAELGQPTLSGKVLFLQIRLIFICFIPFAWLGLVLSLTGKLETFRKTFIILLLIVPTTTALLALTTRMHNQFRYDFAIETVNGLQLLTFERSNWDMFHEVSNHLVSLLGFIILLTAWHSSSGYFRKQTTLLGISFIIPLSVNLLFVFDVLTLGGINPTPFVLLPSSILQAYVVLSSRILDIVPAARSIVLDSIDIGILMLDSHGHIIDINPAAQTYTDTKEQEALGHSLDVLPEPWDSMLYWTGPLEAKVDGYSRWFVSKQVPVDAGTPEASGTLILLHDATVDVVERRELELKRDLVEQQNQLRLQQLLLRDIHDGLGGLTSNLAFMSVIASNAGDVEKKNEWLQKIELTATETNSEIRDLMNTLGNTSMSWGDLVASIRRTADILFHSEDISVKFVLDHIPEDGVLGLAEGMSIIRMVRECHNNVVKHAEATEVTVTVDISTAYAEITVCDNGSGFDPEEALRGRGLNNLEKRATELGGFILTDSAPPGTRQTIRIPLPVKISTQLEDEVSS